MACTWAWLDGGKEMRNRERVVGCGRWLGMCAPWLDAVGATMETHIQVLADRHARSRPAWPACHSAINGVATASTATCARHPTGLEAQRKDDATATAAAASRCMTG